MRGGIDIDSRGGDGGDGGDSFGGGRAGDGGDGGDSTVNFGGGRVPVPAPIDVDSRGGDGGDGGDAFGAPEGHINVVRPEETAHMTEAYEDPTQGTSEPMEDAADEGNPLGHMPGAEMADAGHDLTATEDNYDA